MRHFYVIANYAKPHTLFCVQEIKEYLTAKGAECVIAQYSFHPLVHTI